MEVNTRTDLEFLASLLDQAARYAQEKINAIPESVGVEEEMTEIEAIIAPAAAIADYMVALPVIGTADDAAKARAQAWLDGRYWSDFARAA